MTAPLAALREELKEAEGLRDIYPESRLALSLAHRLFLRAEAADADLEVVQQERDDAITKRDALQARVAALEAVLKDRPRCEAVRVLGGCGHTWCERVRTLLAAAVPGTTP